MAKLQDLYRRGKEQTITDEEGNKATFYLKKLNPIESKTALEKANASRARYLISKRDPASDAYLSTLSELESITDDELAVMASAPALSNKMQSIEAEVASKDEWSKEDYYLTLKESWEETNKEIWGKTRLMEDGVESDYTDDQIQEAEKVLEEMERFDAQVNEEIDKETARLVRENKRLSRQELELKCVDDAFDRRANGAWVETYYQYQVYFATVDKKDKRTRLFDSIDEVQELEQEVYLQLLHGYRELEVDAVEGK